MLVTLSCFIVARWRHRSTGRTTLLIGPVGLLLALFATVCIAGCSGGGTAGAEKSDDPLDGMPPVSNIVYERIQSTTDCFALQREFDIADENADRLLDAGRRADVPIKYMGWADDRMNALDCYG